MTDRQTIFAKIVALIIITATVVFLINEIAKGSNSEIQASDLNRIEESLKKIENNGYSLNDENYLKVRKDVIEAVGINTAGRNILMDKKENGKYPSDKEISEEINRLEYILSPTKKVEENSYKEQTSEENYTEEVSQSSGAAPDVVQCESGGDYGANTGNGYYGGYQFDSQTWDAYGDPAYGEANEAPPAVQDAAAASVPYDAWPNC